MAFDIEMIKKVYERMPERVKKAREIVGRPLTLAEKILYTHLWDGMPTRAFGRAKDYVDFAPDRIACQDATAQMALLQFMHAGKPKVAVPTTVHCDHLIQAKVGAETDLKVAKEQSKEVFDFLSSVSNTYGIGFWQPGAGIIHQIVLENWYRLTHCKCWWFGNACHWGRGCRCGRCDGWNALGAEISETHRRGTYRKT